jgi:hypothetical protein
MAVEKSRPWFGCREAGGNVFGGREEDEGDPRDRKKT